MKHASLEEVLVPEFVGAKSARILFGLSRTHLYQLADSGHIRSVVLRKKGAARGRRLFVCDSIREYLSANIQPTGE